MSYRQETFIDLNGLPLRPAHATNSPASSARWINGLQINSIPTRGANTINLVGIILHPLSVGIGKTLYGTGS